jgi:hypothetical protein
MTKSRRADIAKDIAIAILKKVKNLSLGRSKYLDSSTLHLPDVTKGNRSSNLQSDTIDNVAL